ncbi:hypothetical protein EVAR_100452_1 [Eumeta japonica]|uniref:Uncharacterized protein n=1 Tax=Eumeta variegata TaxID=151549 RepID=A0A4C1ZXA6_EUMVA|nr:hypothetical protein EVAR_100452_1 [Eumeta japonica]
MLCILCAEDSRRVKTTFSLFIRSKRARGPLKSRWSPPPMRNRNPGRVTCAAGLRPSAGACYGSGTPDDADIKAALPSGPKA